MTKWQIFKSNRKYGKIIPHTKEEIMSFRPKKSIAEMLDEIAQIGGTNERVAAIRAMDHPITREIFSCIFNPDIKFLLPEGPTEYKPDQFDDFGALWREWRRMYIFIDGPKAPPLTEKRRMQLWIQLLESLHPRDAEMLDRMKDKKGLWNLAINRYIVSKAFPDLPGIREDKPLRPRGISAIRVREAAARAAEEGAKEDDSGEE